MDSCRRIFSVPLIVVLLLSPAVTAQTPPDGTPPYPYANFTPPMAIIIVVLIAALFLMGFFSIYLRHCTTMAAGSVRPLGATGSLRRRAAGASRGLAPEVIETFPTFEYSTVKGMKIGKGALECAVCLNEFEDEDTLRLIPKCDHVFHPECIDMWLGSHVTCPVCRSNLVPQPGETLEVPELAVAAENSGDSGEPTSPRNDDVSIRVREEGEEHVIPDQMVVERNGSVKQNRPPRTRSFRPRMLSFGGKFPRSHSTGHSLVGPGENTDRFKLRLPEDVRKQMVSRALNRTASCLPNDGGSQRAYRPGFGEGSSRGMRSFKRLDRGVRSDRWVFSMAPPFFARSSSSVRSPKVMGGDGSASVRGNITSDGSTSSRGMKAAVKLPSFKCLEPRGEGDEPGLIAGDSARLPV